MYSYRISYSYENEKEKGNLHCISWKEGKFKGRDGCPG